MYKQIEQVRVWHEKFGVPVYSEPLIPSQDRIDLRYNLMLEELNELKNATNRIEMADAIGDMLYVLLGTAHEYGIAPYLPDIFDEIQRSNMSKLDASGNPIKRADGKILKSPLFTPPDILSILNKQK